MNLPNTSLEHNLCVKVLCKKSVYFELEYTPTVPHFNCYNSKSSKVSTVSLDERNPYREVNIWGLRSSGMLRSLRYYLFTDIRDSWSVPNSRVKAERRPQLHRGGSLNSRKIILPHPLNKITRILQYPRFHKVPFYTHGSVHRDSIFISSNEMQQYAGAYLLQNYSTCFGYLSHPSSGAHHTVTSASGTGHTVRGITFLQRDLIRPRWRKVVALILWPVPEAAFTVWCTPDDGSVDIRNI